MKVLGAFVSPKGITSHSNSQSLVLKAVFHSSPTRSRIWWYPLQRSTLENICAPCNTSNISSKRGMGKRYFTVNAHAPTSIFFRSAGTAHGLKLSRINPLSSRSWTWHWSSLCSVGLILYAGIFGRVAPGIKSTACCISLMGGNVWGSSSGVIS